MTHIDRADFLTHLTSELVASGAPREFNNIDRTRFDHSSSAKTAFKEKVLGLAASLGFYRAAVISHEQLRHILKTDGLDEAYGLFQDQLSRDLFTLAETNTFATFPHSAGEEPYRTYFRDLDAIHPEHKSPIAISTTSEKGVVGGRA